MPTVQASTQNVHARREHAAVADRAKTVSDGGRAPADRGQSLAERIAETPTHRPSLELVADNRARQRSDGVARFQRERIEAQLRGAEEPSRTGLGVGGPDRAEAGRRPLSVESSTLDAKKKDIPENTREITRNPLDVTDMGTPEQQAAARATVEARAEAEAAALDGLSEDRRASYGEVATLIDFDPLAREALQDMLLDGRFEGDAGGRILDNLGDMATGELLGSIDRPTLVADTVQEIHDPAAINQGPRGTCAATSASIWLAHEMPDEYVRVVAGLASPEGEVTLRGGQTVNRQPGTEADDGFGRSQSNRLIAPMLMELGNPALRYSNESDRHSLAIPILPDIPLGRGGMTSSEFDRAVEALTGEVFDTVTVNRRNRADHMTQLGEATADGAWVPVALKWGDGGHKVLVTGLDDDFVHYVNPWGQEERMDRREFEHNLRSVSYPPE